MKLALDEQVKYRLTGLIVVISIGAIFLPAMMKKQPHHYIESMSLSVNLPAKPTPPKIDVAQERALFQSVKVAKTVVPKIELSTRVSQLAAAEPISAKSVVPALPQLAKNAPVLTKKPAIVAVERSKTPPVLKVAVNSQKKQANRVIPAKLISPNKTLYAVQLGSFAQQNNAKLLVNRLRSKGYIASYNKFTGKQGQYYQVLVGQMEQKVQAINLQKKLSSSLQLDGFIVKKGVG